MRPSGRHWHRPCREAHGKEGLTGGRRNAGSPAGSPADTWSVKPYLPPSARHNCSFKMGLEKRGFFLQPPEGCPKPQMAGKEGRQSGSWSGNYLGITRFLLQSVTRFLSQRPHRLQAGLAILTAKNEVGRDILINDAREAVGRWARWEAGGSIQQNEASVGGLRFCRGSGAQGALVHGGLGRDSIPAERPWEETGCRDGRRQFPGPP